MKNHLRSLFILVLGLAAASVARAQGTAFTYQGRLTDQGVPANGAYDFRFRLFDAVTNGSFSGGVVMLDAVGVNNGLFTVTLDFGAAPFNGSDRWLEIAVRTNGGAFTNLAPRQPITATPYAVRALSAGTASSYTGGISDSQLSGNIARLNSNAVFTGAVVFSNAASQFTGSFTGNGAGVTNVNLSTLNSLGMITPNASLFASCFFTMTGPAEVTATFSAANAPFVEAFREVLAKGRYHTLCEIGCGSGLVLNDLAHRLPQLDTLWGIDLSEQQTARNWRRRHGIAS